MKNYWYALIMVMLLVVGVSASVQAQTNPSGTANMVNTDYADNRPNYNYLGLLGLLGLYGLHKKRMKEGTIVGRDRS